MARRKFYVNICAKVWTEVPVLAESLEEALMLGRDIPLEKSLKHGIDKGFIDCNQKVISVNDPKFNTEND